MSEFVEEDDEFLSQIAIMEADAISAKRRKITTSTGAVINSPESNASGTEEGAYLAALKGSKSREFQQQFTTNNNYYKANVAVFANTSAGLSTGGGGGGGDSCFKCGKSGHWARDCDANTVDSLVPEKVCPCGSGPCVVLTANTEKNRGRKFYKCPLREENGGCGFFEWCDKSSDNMIIRSQNYTMNPSVSELLCPCGAGSCITLTAKTGKNIGQQFYRCPAPAPQKSCGFFKWCNDHTTTMGANNTSEMSNKSFGNNGSSCFKGDKDGHWTKDCSQSSSFPAPVNLGGKSASSSYTCFKCGKDGHWAKDCSQSLSPPPAPVNLGGKSASSSYTCFKCGKNGHWAKDCSQSSSSSPAPVNLGGKSASSPNTCFKCGKDGHWANDCSPSSPFPAPVNLGGKSASSSNTCFKCGKEGHWAKDCSSSTRVQFR